MNEYIRQLDETGLKLIGYAINTLNSINVNDASHVQHTIACVVLDLEKVLNEHVISLDNRNNT